MDQEQLGQLIDVSYWRQLCPDLTVNETTPLTEASDFGGSNSLRESDWNNCKETIHEDGYFAYDAWYSAELIDRLADCFLRLESAGLHPVFAFVYDEFWDLLLQLQPLLSDLLGEYDLLPSVWSWFVRDSNQTAFPPHRDQVREVGIDDDDHLDYLTLWIPLTDLNHLSSSMCVLPASADPDYEDGTPNVRVENLQDIRSLQGARGSVFCWTTQLVHWGTKQSAHGQPRMSVGYFVQRRDAEPLEWEAMSFEKPFTLNQRLAIIGNQIIDYSRTAGDEELRLARTLADLD